MYITTWVAHAHTRGHTHHTHTHTTCICMYTICMYACLHARARAHTHTGKKFPCTTAILLLVGARTDTRRHAQAVRQLKHHKAGSVL